MSSFRLSTGQTGDSLFGTNTGDTRSLFEGMGVKCVVGTTVPFNPPNGQDTMINSGVTTKINTKHQCITAMKEYENKSLEELHMEDYRANRKSKLAGSNAGFSFGGGQDSGLQTSTMGFGGGQDSGLQTSTMGFGGGQDSGLQTSTVGFGGGQDSDLQTSTMGFGGFRTSTGQAGSSLFGTNTYSLFGHKYLYVNRAVGGASTVAFTGHTAAVGTTVPFNPPNGQDTMMKSGVTTNINTKHQCITAMKEYENKSLEELHMEDYSANRKSKQTGSTSKVDSYNQTPSTQATAGFSFGGGQSSGVQTSTVRSYNQIPGTQATTGFSFGGGQGSGLQTSTVGFESSSRGGLCSIIKPARFSATSTGIGTRETSCGFETGLGTGTTTNRFVIPAAKPATETDGNCESTGTSGGSVCSIIKPTRFGATSTGNGAGGTSCGFETGLGTGTTTNTFVIPAAKPAVDTGGGNCESTGTSGGSVCSIIKPTRFGATSTGNGAGGTSCGFETGLGTGTTTNTFVKPAAKPAVDTGGGNCKSTGDLIGIKTCNTNEIQKDIPCLNINSKKMHPQKEMKNSKKMPLKQPDKEEHFDNAQSLDNCLQTGQECITNRGKDKQLLTDKQKALQTLIQTVKEAQAGIEDSNELKQKIIKEQKEINDKHEKQLEKLTVTLDNILGNFQALCSSTGLLETKAVDTKQFSDVQMKFEILEVNSENVRCSLDDHTQLQELTNKVDEASKNITPVPELKNVQKAEEKLNAFEEEWSKSKEEVGTLYNDFEIKNTILYQLIADRLAPLQELRHIFNKQLDATKDNVKKLDTVCDQMTDLLAKFLQQNPSVKNHLSAL